MRKIPRGPLCPLCLTFFTALSFHAPCSKNSWNRLVQETCRSDIICSIGGNFILFLRLRNHFKVRIEEDNSYTEVTITKCRFHPIYLTFWYYVFNFQTKVRHIKSTCEILVKDYDGDIPESVEDLCKLPGVGPKMAHLCMNIAWNQMSGIGEKR